MVGRSLLSLSAYLLVAVFAGTSTVEARQGQQLQTDAGGTLPSGSLKPYHANRRGLLVPVHFADGTGQATGKYPQLKDITLDNVDEEYDAAYNEGQGTDNVADAAEDVKATASQVDSDTPASSNAGTTSDTASNAATVGPPAVVNDAANTEHVTTDPGDSKTVASTDVTVAAAAEAGTPVSSTTEPASEGVVASATSTGDVATVPAATADRLPTTTEVIAADAAASSTPGSSTVTKVDDNDDVEYDAEVQAVEAGLQAAGVDQQDTINERAGASGSSAATTSTGTGSSSSDSASTATSGSDGNLAVVVSDTNAASMPAAGGIATDSTLQAASSTVHSDITPVAGSSSSGSGNQAEAGTDAAINKDSVVYQPEVMPAPEGEQQQQQVLVQGVDAASPADAASTAPPEKAAATGTGDTVPTAAAEVDAAANTIPDTASMSVTPVVAPAVDGTDTAGSAKGSSSDTTSSAANSSSSNTASTGSNSSNAVGVEDGWDNEDDDQELGDGDKPNIDQPAVQVTSAAADDTASKSADTTDDVVEAPNSVGSSTGNASNLDAVPATGDAPIDSTATAAADTEATADKPTVLDAVSSTGAAAGNAVTMDVVNSTGAAAAAENTDTRGVVNSTGAAGQADVAANTSNTAATGGKSDAADAYDEDDEQWDQRDSKPDAAAGPGTNTATTTTGTAGSGGGGSGTAPDAEVISSSTGSGSDHFGVTQEALHDVAQPGPDTMDGVTTSTTTGDKNAAAEHVDALQPQDATTISLPAPPPTQDTLTYPGTTIDKAITDGEDWDEVHGEGDGWVGPGQRDGARKRRHRRHRRHGDRNRNHGDGLDAGTWGPANAIDAPAFPQPLAYTWGNGAPSTDPSPGNSGTAAVGTDPASTDSIPSTVVPADGVVKTPAGGSTEATAGGSTADVAGSVPSGWRAVSVAAGKTMNWALSDEIIMYTGSVALIVLLMIGWVVGSRVVGWHGARVGPGGRPYMPVNTADAHAASMHHKPHQQQSWQDWDKDSAEWECLESGTLKQTLKPFSSQAKVTSGVESDSNRSSTANEGRSRRAGGRAARSLQPTKTMERPLLSSASTSQDGTGRSRAGSCRGTGNGSAMEADISSDESVRVTGPGAAAAAGATSPSGTKPERKPL